MATKPTDRHCTVHFYDLIINSRTAKGFKVASPGCAPIRDVLQVALSGVKRHELNPEAKVLMKSLDDVRQLPSLRNGFVLLLNCADITKPDPRFKNFKTKALRPAGKQTIEAVTKSCHALLIPDSRALNKALLVMTMRSGITSDDVADFLNRLSALASAKPKNSQVYEFKDPSAARGSDGNLLKYRVNYNFSVLAHASENLDNALRTGTFKEMTLIEHDQYAFDQAGNLQVTEKSLTVKAASAAPMSWARIKQSIKNHMSVTQDDQFDRVKVRYATSQGEDKSTTMQLNDLDEAFTRREHIVLDVNTPDCFTSIDTGIITDLQELIS